MPDATADRIALRNLVETYAHGCDARDEAVLVSCFVDGGTLVVHWLDRDATTMIAPDDIRRIPRTLGAYDRTLHFIGNHRAHIDGDDGAGETYCFAHHISGTSDHVMAIRYEDTYRRTPGGWKFVVRQLRLEWTEDRPIAR